MLKKHLVFVDREKWDRDLIKKTFPKEKLTFLSRLGSWDKIKDADALSIFINTKVTASALEKLLNLKFIATRSTGFDHIDLEACKARGIKVANVPTYGENTVAEHTFGLILALSRKLVQAVNRTRKGDFSIEGLMGFDLNNKVLGVIGGGNIGKHVIRMALGFQMKVIVSDPCLTATQIKKLGGTKVTLSDLMKKSDIITLHCPLCKATCQMINNKQLKLVKKGALLINTARGELMDTTAVLKYLERGVLGGVGLDAVEAEKIIKSKALLKKPLEQSEMEQVLENYSLLKHENVIITPHIAFNTKEAVGRILQTTLENIQGHLRGQNKNLIN